MSIATSPITVVDPNLKRRFELFKAELSFEYNANRFDRVIAFMVGIDEIQMTVQGLDNVLDEWERYWRDFRTTIDLFGDTVYDFDGVRIHSDMKGFVGLMRDGEVSHFSFCDMNESCYMLEWYSRRVHELVVTRADYILENQGSRPVINLEFLD